ncbi:Ribokinase-like protein [Microdochium trichocladiopsis]|uniref:ATP-dependent (S)-NAD(P)H-hydrate dehydratase n=1 Tax=Microdochium trichocladiopsis TaxID=1682393 RepID=A0A9P8Y1B8_9PEZI|nr:Ribokinase-like protein [Microdochium trichocladiopsis]KAH7027360.1 Ribokinase-like protein [Microdochium trichocladiopsis]
MSPPATGQPEMSSATKELLAKVRQIVPPMLGKFHKGQLGRVAVIGGSEDYTGAPYFSAMASARLGCDMSHVICTPGAAAVIKTYSPNLMVHPLMRQSPSDAGSSQNPADTDPKEISKKIIEMLPRLHVLVVGPGLGRDPLMHDTLAEVLAAARERRMPVVMDADSLGLVLKSPELVMGWREVVLTPNVVEFGRLWKGVKSEDYNPDQIEGDPARHIKALSKALGGVTIVQKGGVDLISNGDETLVVDLQGGLKRSGGQGDTLTGSIATFLGWRNAYLEKLWDHGGDMKEDELLRLAAFGGAAITRECSRLAFEKHGRSLQASDLTEQVHVAFMTLFGEPDK